MYRVIFDNNNECYLITDKGIVNATTRKAYMPGKSFYHSESALRGDEAFDSLDDDVSTFVDKDNNIWVFFGHGEWGDDMFIFNSKTSKFIPVSGWIGIPYFETKNHLFSVTHDFHDTYVIQYDEFYGADHSISMFKGKGVYQSSDDLTFPGGIKDLDFYVGGYSYKEKEKCFYFITSKGLNKLNLKGHSFKFGDAIPIKSYIVPKHVNKRYRFIDHQKTIDKYENSLTPRITKLEFTAAGQLVLLAPMNGIWLFNGQKLITLE